MLTGAGATPDSARCTGSDESLSGTASDDARITGRDGAGQPQSEESVVSMEASRPERKTTCSPGFTSYLSSPINSETMADAEFPDNACMQVLPRESALMA